MAKADADGILFETVHQRKDGTTFPVEVSSRGVTVGGTRTLVSVVRDISARKRMEAELYRSRDALELRLLSIGELLELSLWREAEAQGVKVRAICVINPGNPTGSVMDWDNIAMVIRFAKAHNLAILADEVYQENVYLAGDRFVSFAKVLTAFPAVFLLMAGGYLAQMLPWSWDLRWERGLVSVGWIGRLLVLAVAAWVAIQVRGSQIQPFIYFQF